MRIRAESGGGGNPALRLGGGEGGLFAFAALVSGFVNLLMLTGPLFMLQVYDRVLASRSEETLAALFALVTALFGLMALLDWARGRVLARIGARVQMRLDAPLFARLLCPAPGRTVTPEAAQALGRVCGAPVMHALFDLPWTPLFAATLFLFHPLLGLLALSGGLVLLALSALSQRLFGRFQPAATEAENRAAALMAQALAGRGCIRGLGMGAAVTGRWRALRRAALKAELTGGDRAGACAALIRAFRLYLQAAMLGLGALLVIRGEISAGAMIAGSILMGRALAPLESLANGWPMLARALKARADLAALPAAPPAPAPAALPSRPRLTLREVGLRARGGGAALQGIGFALEPGQALGVIGESGAGKSALARLLTGAETPDAGSLTLGGIPPARLIRDGAAPPIGYLPQEVVLFDGTIGENIARFAANPPPGAVPAAARAAGIEAAIGALPSGLDTPLCDVALPGGLRQRIGLARALYGGPALLVLDEPNASLDSAGTRALNRAIREHCAGGGMAVVIAHRPAALAECALLLVLEAGRMRAFGPRDRVLRETVQNVARFAPALAAGGA